MASMSGTSVTPAPMARRRPQVLRLGEDLEAHRQPGGRRVRATWLLRAGPHRDPTALAPASASTSARSRTRCSPGAHRHPPPPPVRMSVATALMTPEHVRSRAGSGDMSAVATDMPRSRWRRVAMRRPCCTASFMDPRWSPSSAAVASRSHTVWASPKKPGSPSPALSGRADELHDHLTHAEEDLAHRRAIGVGVPLAAASRRAPRWPPPCGPGRGRGARRGRCRWPRSACSAGSAGGASDAVVGSPSRVPSAKAPSGAPRKDHPRIRLP